MAARHSKTNQVQQKLVNNAKIRIYKKREKLLLLERKKKKNTG